MRNLTTLLFVSFLSFGFSQHFVNGVLYAKLKQETNTVQQKPSAVNPIGITKATALSTRYSSKTGKPLAPSTSGIERIYKIEFNGNFTPLEAAEILNNTGLYEYVSPCPIPKPLLVPNDPFASDQFSNPKDGQTPLYTHTFWQAWDIETGDTNVVIAVVDGGINFNHEDMGNFKINANDPINGINDDGNYLSDTSLQLVDDYRGWDLGDWDNDPTAPAGSTHGTEVTGIVSAMPNNGIGTVGTGYNCKYVHYKVAKDSDPYSYDKGYDGLLLAAENGADVINLSWGATGDLIEPFLPVINDLITYIVDDLNVVVLAAAGNSGLEETWYPAAHPKVISVTGIRTDASKQGISTYDYSVDIAASGWFAKTPLGSSNSNYNNSTGTSVATPVVSGAAALLRSKFPSYTAKQVMEQLRVSGDIVDTLAINSAYQYKMGRKLNPYKALTDTTLPSIRLKSYTKEFTVNKNGDIITLSPEFINYLSSTQNTSIELLSLNPNYIVTSNTLTINTINHNQSISFTDAFSIATPATNDTVVLELLLKTTSPNLKDHEYFTITLFPDLVSSLNTLQNQLISIAPNPSNGIVTINLLHQVEMESIHILSPLGKTEAVIALNETTNRLKINLNEHLSKKGIYFLNIYTSKGLFVEKILLNE